MKPTLQFRIAQQLTLTPQLQQAIRMLQMSSLELAHEVEQALRENPFLERTDESIDSFGSGDFQASSSEASKDSQIPPPSSDRLLREHSTEEAIEPRSLTSESEGFENLAASRHGDETSPSSTDDAPAGDDPKAWEQAAWDLQTRSQGDSDDEDRQRDWRSTEDLLSDHLKQQLLACHVTERDVVRITELDSRKPASRSPSR
jgi:RNA polymerase sigma-54 factor